MTTYLLVLLVLTLLAYVPIWLPRHTLLALVAASVLLALFAGLRFETGFDWPVYKAIFNGGITLTIEPLYLALNKAVAFVGGDIQLLFFVVAVFNIATLSFIIWKISPSAALLVWMVYFGFTFLPAQMAMERQSIASSFVLIGLLLSYYGRPIFAAIFIVIGCGFHVSVILFLPLLLVRRWRPNGWGVAAIVAIGCIVVAAQIDLFTPVGIFLLRNGWTTLSDRMSYYVTTGTSPISLAALGYTAMQIALLTGLYRLPNDDERRDPLLVTAIWLTIAILMALLFFAGMPSIWSRILLVSLPWQVAALYRLEAFSRLSKLQQTGVVTAAAVVSFGILIYYVGRPTTVVFRPYNSVLHVYITGNRGDGEARSNQMIDLVNDAAAKKAK